MSRQIPPKIYAPRTQDEITREMRRGIMPAAFTRRMRVINLLSMVALGKIEEAMLLPFDTMDLHHILERQISQDAIIDQMDNEPLSYALTTGDIRPLWDAASNRPKLRNSFITGWSSRFFEVPFDPICIMLALRIRLLLELIDELGHSYNLMRFFPPEVFGPIIPPPSPPIPPEPIPPIPPFPPGPPPPSPTPPKDDDYVPPWDLLKPDPIGLPGGKFGDGATLGPEGPGTFDPGADPGDPGGPGEPGGPMIDIFDGPGPDWDGFGGGPGGGSPWGGGYNPGPDGGGGGGGGGTSPTGGDPCADVDDPTKTVVIGYTTQAMQVSEEQTLTVKNRHPRWSYENYHWEISAGGGSLSSDVGLSVVYTAPATNPNCELNATIDLICGGNVVDSLGIAINADTTDTWAFRYWSGLSCIESIPDVVYTCFLTNNTYDCAGNLLAGYPCELIRQAGSCGECYADTSPADCHSSYNTMSQLLAASPVDLRNAAAIEMGCCPEGSL